MEGKPGIPARLHRNQYPIAALITAVIVGASITGFVWAEKGVTMTVDGRVMESRTQAFTVGAMLEESGVHVRSGDLVIPDEGTILRDGTAVTVRHAVPVTVIQGGTASRVDVVGDTVVDALTAVGVGPDVAVEPPVNTPLTHDLVITVPDTFVRVSREETSVPFRVQTRLDPTMARGTRAVVRKGRVGTAVRLYRVIVTSGDEAVRELAGEHVVREPVPEVVAVGTASASAAYVAARYEGGGVPSPPSAGTARELVVTATGYAPGSDGVDNWTATGARAGYGVIAVDPRVIPFGTRLYIPGYGYGVAADTGGAIKGNRIDLCFANRAEAMWWGRRTLTILVLP